MKTIFRIIPTLFLSVGVMAQNYNDAILFNQCDYVGTARSQAMGSAFGALGADLTSQSINPAGLAAYRATEIGLSLGVNINKTNSTYYGYKNNDDKISVPFNNIGAAFTFGNVMRENATGVLNHDFSISYSRLADYNRAVTYSDMYGRNSMLDYFCADNNSNDEQTYILAKNAGWIYDSFTDEDTGTQIDLKTNSWEQPYLENDNAMLDIAARVDNDGLGLVDHTQHVKEKGYKGETSFSYAMNISDKIYWGLSIGIQSLNYREKVNHYEQYFGQPYEAANDFTYTTTLRQDGTGVNFKLGAIVKPINALRIGVAIHSPSFYKIDELYSSTILGASDDYTYNSKELENNYSYRVPGKVIGSLAGIISNFAIISVDYEMSDYGKSKFKDSDGESDRYFDDLTNQMKSTLKRVHTLRAGIEGRILESLYLRAGYNMQTTPFKNRILVSGHKHNAITGGIGFRRNNFFFDAAYVYRVSNGDRWVLPDSEQYKYETNVPATYKSKNHNIALTAGFRF